MTRPALVLVGLVGLAFACGPTHGPPHEPPIVAGPSEASPARANEARGPGYANARLARDEVAASLLAHLRETGEVASIEFHYTGKFGVAGHLAKPGQIDELEIAGRDAFAGEDAAHHGTLRSGDEPEQTTTTLVTRAGAASRDPWQDVAESLGPESRAAALLELRRKLPHEFLRAALAAPASLRELGEVPLEGRTHVLVSYSDASGTWNLYLDANTRLLTRAERLIADPIEGDASEWFEFSDYVAIEGVMLPRHMSELRIESDWSWRRELVLDSIHVGGPIDPDTFALPEGLSPSAAPVDALEPIEVIELAKDVYSFELREHDIRVLVVAFADHSVVLEAPLSSEIGEAILARVAELLPDKPVRHLAIGHHHPHYSAGLRPFVHAGVTLVTTPGNQALFESVASRPHRLDPDAQQHEPKAPEFMLVRGRLSLGDANTRLELIDIGEASHHTDEYLLFFLPAQGLLFEGDLGWLPSGEADARTGRRARRLLEIIEGQALAVERVVQAWPLADQQRVVTIEQLRTWAKLPE